MGRGRGEEPRGELLIDKKGETKKRKKKKKEESKAFPYKFEGEGKGQNPKSGWAVEKRGRRGLGFSAKGIILDKARGARVIDEFEIRNDKLGTRRAQEN